MQSIVLCHEQYILQRSQGNHEIGLVKVIMNMLL